MLYRLFVLVSLITCLLSACTPAAEQQVAPTFTAVPSATQPPTALPATSTPQTQPTSASDWWGLLEAIASSNWERLQLLKTFPAEMPLLNSAVAISPDGRTLAVGSNSTAQIFFFDLPTGQLSQTLTINGVSNTGKPFQVIEYLPDGTMMANATGPYRIYHIAADGNVLSAWDGASFALSADKATMAHGTAEGVTLTDIATNTALGSFAADYAVEYSFVPGGSAIAVNVVGVDYADTLIWDIVRNTQRTALTETGNPRFSPNGKYLAVTDYVEGSNPLKIFTPDGATEITTLFVTEPNGLNGRPPIWSLDSSVIAAQIGNGPTAAWDTTGWQPLQAPALQGELYSFSPDGRILITRATDGGILLWGVLP